MGPTAPAEEETRMQRQYVTDRNQRGPDAFFEKRDPPIAQEEQAAIDFLQQLRDIAESVSVESDIDGIKAAHETNHHATLSIHPTDDPTWSTCRWVTAEGTAQETLEQGMVALAAGLYCQRENVPYEARAAELAERARKEEQ